MGTLPVRLFFFAAAAYDGLLGLLFLAAPIPVFLWYGVTPPNHVGYVQFPALLLIVFAVMFVQIGLEPQRHRSMIPYGVLLKASYCAVVLRHWAGAGIPDMWKPFAVIDAATAVVFLWIYWKLGKNEGRSTEGAGRSAA